MKTDSILDRMIKNGASERDIVLYLADNVTITELARQYYQLYLETVGKDGYTPIRISKSDFEKHFRIVGTRVDGGVETRGRKAKENTAE